MTEKHAHSLSTLTFGNAKHLINLPYFFPLNIIAIVKLPKPYINEQWGLNFIITEFIRPWAQFYARQYIPYFVGNYQNSW